mgnify:CR=1 FL=1
MSLLGGIFDFDVKQERLTEVLRELEDPKVWEKPELAQALGKERGLLEQVVDTITSLTDSLQDVSELLDMAIEENDDEILASIEEDLSAYEKQVAGLEFRRMFAGEMDPNNAFLEIQSGSGGTEAQDWAEMILRMYLRWSEQHDFKTELIEVSSGDVAGIKSAITLTVGCELKLVCIDWSVNHPLIREIAGIHRLQRSSYLLK